MNRRYENESPKLDAMNTIMYFRGLPALVGSFILIMASEAWSQSQFQWENFAGMPGGSGNADGSGGNAAFYNPQGLAVDANGNVYVADHSNQAIRKITPAGVVTTLCGGQSGYAVFASPEGICVDASGYVYVSANHTICKVTPGGVATILAGSAGKTGSADGTGSAARFNGPKGLAVDTNGNVYVADTYNDTIRKVTPGGTVTTVAGTAGAYGSTNGVGAAARFDQPWALAVDVSGSIYVVDAANNMIRKIALDGTVSTLAGGPGRYPPGADGDGLTVAAFSFPHGICVDGAGTVYVTDYSNSTVRMITPGGIVSTPAGLAGQGGAVDGTGSMARFSSPVGIGVDGSGNIYVTDNGGIRKVTMSAGVGTVTAFAGRASNAGATDAQGTQARFNGTRGVTMDGNGNVYVIDVGKSAVRKITPGGLVSTLAGGSPGFVNGQGGAAKFGVIANVAVDSDGNVYVADTSNHAIRKITPGGLVSTLAGGAYGAADGQGTAAQFNQPNGVTVDGNGIVYVADSWNHTIRKILPNGTVSTLAGTAGSGGSTDGAGPAARFYYPDHIAVDSSGNLYVPQDLNIRKITPDGQVSTPYVVPAYQDWAGQDLGESLSGLCVDGSGNIYATTAVFHTVRKVTPQGVVTTIGGTPKYAGNMDGFGRAAQFSDPLGVTVSASGSTIYVSDSGNNRIVKGTLVPAPALAVEQLSGIPLSDGISTVDFAAVPLGSNTTRTFTLRNTGGAVLTIGTLSFGGLNPGDFSVTAQPSATVSMGGTTTFTIRFEPSGNGPRGASLSIANDDPAHLSFQLTLAGIGGPTLPSAGKYVWTTFTGLPGGQGNANGQGGVARFDSPTGIAKDGDGNLYVTDLNNRSLRKVTPAGIVTTIVTTPVDMFFQPRGVAVDSAGNIYVSDQYTVRKVTPQGIFSTLAGNGQGAVDGPGTVARFRQIRGLAVDSSGNVFVADSSNHVIRKITPDGTVSTYAGVLGAGGGHVDGSGNVVRFNGPMGVVVDGGGNLFVSDSDNSIRKITTAGVVSTVAGLGNGTFGDLGGQGSSAQFNAPWGLTLDNLGNLYVADTNNNSLRMITPAGVVTTLAGSEGTGNADGAGSNAKFDKPTGVVFDGIDSLYVADSSNQTLRRVTLAGMVSTFAGTAPHLGDYARSGGGTVLDGTGSGAHFTYPRGLTIDGSGNVFVADSGAASVRKMTQAGVVTTFAGGSIVSGADFSWPRAVSVDGTGNVFVADRDHHKIRLVTSAGVVTTVAGGYGSTDGAAGIAKFYLPGGIAVGSGGNVFVADSGNHTIRKIIPDGTVSTYAGLAGSSGTTNGAVSAARFSSPQAIVSDSSGNLFIADTWNNAIRKITAGGTVSTLAGGGSSGAVDGTGSAARFNGPESLCVDGGGNVYVTDTGNHTIRKITPGGVVTTIGGTALISGGLDGVGTSALFSSPAGVTITSSGIVFVSDVSNNRITRGVLTALPAIVVEEPAGIALVNGTSMLDFGSVLTGGSSLKTVTIKNMGSADLTLGTITKAGVNAAEFTIITTGMSTTLASGSSTSFSVSFTPAASGTRAASIQIPSNDEDETPFDLTFTGTGQSSANLSNLVTSSGTLTPAFSPATYNYFVTLPVTTTSITVTPTKADANATVTVNGLPVDSGTASGEISLNAGSTVITTEVTTQAGAPKIYIINVIRPAPTVVTANATVITSTGATLNGSINPNGAATTAAFEWGTSPTLATFSTLAAGTTNAGTAPVAVNAVLTGLTTGTTYYFRIKGTRSDSATPQRGAILSFVPVASPDIAVEHPTGINLTSGVSGIDYGPVIAGRGSIAKTFTIKNTGTGNLTGLSFTKDGTAAADFKVEVTGMKSTLTPGGSTAFTVTFSTAVLGARTEVLHIASNDPDEAPFDITLTGTGAPGIVFESALTMIEEEAGTVDVSIIRTGSYSGAVSVRVNSSPDTATAADFGSVNNVLVSFADGESAKSVTVNITPDTLSEANEVFKLTLSDPLGGASVGSGSTTTVRIIDLIDTVKPTVTIITPAANANVVEGTPVTVTGSAADSKGVRKVQISLNGGLFVDAVTTLAANGLTAAYTAPLAVAPGVNTIDVKSIDTRNNASSVVTRSITYHVPRTLLVTLNSPSSGTVTAGFEPSSSRDVNMPYTITATPKTGFVFDGWVVNDITGTGVTPDEAELPALTFTMQENLHLTASFITNPFAAAAGLTGAFNGPVSPSPDEPAGGTEPDVSTVGQFSATVTTTGSFSGTLKIDGASLPVSTGKFDNDGVARFGTSRAKTLTLKRKSKPDLEVALQLDMTGLYDTITGTVTQKIGSAVEAVSDVLAERAVFSSKSPAPSSLATVAGQRYNLIFPARATQAGLTTGQFPQGTGIGSMIVKSDGTVTFAGTLADNTGFTSSTTLSEEKQCPLFVQLYSLKGSIAGLVTLNPAQTDSDALGLDCLWIRPPQPTLQWYPAGWPDSIQVDLIASKFNIPTGLPAASVIPGLGTLSPNATLSFVGGLLTGQIDKNIHISPTNVVTEVPADSSFTITLTKTTGEITGTFTHSDTKKPTYKATTIQKTGQYQGTWGFFMTMPTAPVNRLGQSGDVRLLPK